MEAEIRRAQPFDAKALLPLVCEHASFERKTATCSDGDLQAQLGGEEPRLIAWIAELDGRSCAYASATIDHATWTGKPYLHLDCLFVRPGYRNDGLGARLLRTARLYALSIGIDELQWQTPAWNERAIQFYVREGATIEAKTRFLLRNVGRSQAI